MAKLTRQSDDRTLDELLASLGPVEGLDWARFRQSITERIEQAPAADPDARLDELLAGTSAPRELDSRRFTEQVSRTIRLEKALGELRSLPLPVDWDALADRITDRVARADRRRGRGAAWRILAPLAAAACVALTVAAWWMRPSDRGAGSVTVVEVFPAPEMQRVDLVTGDAPAVEVALLDPPAGDLIVEIEPPPSAGDDRGDVILMIGGGRRPSSSADPGDVEGLL